MTLKEKAQAVMNSLDNGQRKDALEYINDLELHPITGQYYDVNDIITEIAKGSMMRALQVAQYQITYLSQ